MRFQKLRGCTFLPWPTYCAQQTFDNMKYDCDERVERLYLAQFVRRSPPTRLNSLSLFVTRQNPLERA